MPALRSSQAQPPDAQPCPCSSGLVLQRLPSLQDKPQPPPIGPLAMHPQPNARSRVSSLAGPEGATSQPKSGPSPQKQLGSASLQPSELPLPTAHGRSRPLPPIATARSV